MKALILVPEVNNVVRSEHAYGKGARKVASLIPDIQRIANDKVRVIYNPYRKESRYTAETIRDFDNSKQVLPHLSDKDILSAESNKEYQTLDFFKRIEDYVDAFSNPSDCMPHYLREYYQADFDKVENQSLLFVSDELFINKYATHHWKNVLKNNSQLPKIKEGQAIALIKESTRRSSFELLPVYRSRRSSQKKSKPHERNKRR